MKDYVEYFVPFSPLFHNNNMIEMVRNNLVTSKLLVIVSLEFMRRYTDVKKKRNWPDIMILVVIDFCFPHHIILYVIN